MWGLGLNGRKRWSLCGEESLCPGSYCLPLLPHCGCTPTPQGPLQTVWLPAGRSCRPVWATPAAVPPTVWKLKLFAWLGIIGDLPSFASGYYSYPGGRRSGKSERWSPTGPAQVPVSPSPPGLEFTATPGRRPAVQSTGQRPTKGVCLSF